MLTEIRETRGACGVTLSVECGGDPLGPVVVLLHGVGQTRHSWRHAFTQLIDSGYFAVSFDARGHGDSGWAPDGDYTLDAFAADLRAVATRLPRPAALVGASMGGATALVAHADPPGLPAPLLVLVDVVPRVAEDAAERIRSFMRDSRDGFDSIDAAIEYVNAYNPNRRRSVDGSGLMRNLRSGPDGRLRWHWDPAVVGSSWKRPREGATERLLDAARRVRVPTLLVRGSKSDLVTESGVDEFRRNLAGLEVCDVAGAGHMVAGDRNDAFNDSVIAFLRRHLPTH